MQFDIENAEHRNKLACEVAFYILNHYRLKPVGLMCC